MHVQFTGSLPEDLQGLLRSGAMFLHRAEAIAEPGPQLRALATAVEDLPAIARNRFTTAWHDFARFDATALRRLHAFALLQELRTFAVNGSLRLWDPRLEAGCALADAALLRWQGFGVTVAGLAVSPPTEMTPAEQTAYQEAATLLATEGELAQVQFLEGMALWHAQQALADAARHFHRHAAASRDAHMGARQRTLADRLDVLARQLDDVLYGRGQ